MGNEVRYWSLREVERNWRAMRESEMKKSSVFEYIKELFLKGEKSTFFRIRSPITQQIKTILNLFSSYLFVLFLAIFKGFLYSSTAISPFNSTLSEIIGFYSSNKALEVPIGIARDVDVHSKFSAVFEFPRSFHFHNLTFFAFSCLSEANTYLLCLTVSG